MKYFKVYEIVDRNTYEILKEDALSIFSDTALIMLDGVREFFGAPVTVNNWYQGGRFQYRGFRPPNCTQGAKNSPHKLGMAFDFDVKNHTAEEVRKKILENQDNPLLQYITRLEGEVNWVHADTMLVPKGKERIYVFHP